MADELDFGATMRGMSAGQKLFGRYTLTKILGRGGMGVVWLARDESLERDVAIKLLPEVVANDPVAIRDLKRETAKSQRLTHPRILRIYDFVEQAGLCGITMELVEGGTLAARRLAQPGEVFSVETLTPWVRQLCEALDYAHQEVGIVHRDLKPANLMLEGNDGLKVADFGIAASVSDTVSRASVHASSSGTPVYMSPQQMLGEKPAVSDDIYALGATLYELLTGKPPFYTGNVIVQVQNKVPPPVTARRAELEVSGGGEVPPAWEKTIAACLAKDPAERPQSAGEVLARLGGAAAMPRTSHAQHPTSNLPSPDPSVSGGSSGQSKIPKSKIPAMATAAGVAALAVVGWWFGIHAPEQRRVEAARLAQERLANARGGVVITTTPSGADVTVGGFARERTPATLREVRLGSYPVVVRLEGYEEVSATVEVKENEFATLNLSLTRSTGDLELASNPPGLEVTVAGRNIPGAPTPRTVRTPTKVEGLPTGEYTLTYRRPDWPEQVQTVRVERRTTASALAEFVGGGLQVASTPRGAEVWSQGRRLGTTPLTLNDLPPGNVEFEFRLAHHRSATRSGRVAARETTRVEVSLEAIRGPQPGQRLTIPDLNLEMLPIAAGSFVMGSPDHEAGRMADRESPQTRVTISRPYWLGQTEVTQRQWQLLMGENPSHFKNAGPHAPVEGVSWNQAMEFCRKLTERERTAGRLPEDYVYTLPSEAQWEYAARAGSTTAIYTGALTIRGENNGPELDAIAWYAGNSVVTGDGGFDSSPWPDKQYPHTQAGTQGVRRKQSNAWGLYDMLGNVQEWCLDWYGTYPGGSVSDYIGPESFSGRVVRGGSWGSNAQTVRAAYRDWWPTDHRNFSVGFRVALSFPAVASAAGGSAALHPRPEPNHARSGESGVSMGDLFDVAELDQPPVPTTRASPIYPFEMRRAGVTGEVVIGFIVDSSGNVVQARVVRSSRSEFEQPALQAVSRWKFQPGRKDGRAVNTRSEVPISFTISD